MSHRALVVFPSEGGTHEPPLVDIYKSQNGGHQLKLYPILESHTRDGRPREVIGKADIPDSLTTEIAEIHASFGSEKPDEKLVDSEEIATREDEHQLGEMVDFVRYEAVYQVQPTTERPVEPVSVYLPVFVEIGLIALFARFIEFEVYSKSQLPSDHHAAINRIQTDGRQPEISITEEEYLHLEDDTEAYEQFVETHLGILQTLYALPPDHGRDTTLAIVVTENNYVAGRIDTTTSVPLPNPVGAGLLIELPVDDFAYDQLVNLYSDWRYLTNRLRINHSLEALRGFLTSQENDTKGAEHLDRNQTKLLQSLGQEFGNDISDLSPDSFLTRIDDSL